MAQSKKMYQTVVGFGLPMGFVDNVKNTYYNQIYPLKQNTLVQSIAK